jgi:hypothetical protein
MDHSSALDKAPVHLEMRTGSAKLIEGGSIAVQRQVTELVVLGIIQRAWPCAVGRALIAVGNEQMVSHVAQGSR